VRTCKPAFSGHLADTILDEMGDQVFIQIDIVHLTSSRLASIPYTDALSVLTIINTL
jgi:hypothetical protein